MSDTAIPDPSILAGELARLVFLLPKSELVILILLAAQCKQRQSNEFRMTIRELQELSTLAPMTISKSLKNLMGIGLIEVSGHSGPFARKITVDFQAISEMGQPDPVEVPQVRKRTRKAA